MQPPLPGAGFFPLSATFGKKATGASKPERSSLAQLVLRNCPIPTSRRSPASTAAGSFRTEALRPRPFSPSRAARRKNSAPSRSGPPCAPIGPSKTASTTGATAPTTKTAIKSKTAVLHRLWLPSVISPSLRATFSHQTVSANALAPSLKCIDAWRPSPNAPLPCSSSLGFRMNPPCGAASRVDFRHLQPGSHLFWSQFHLIKTCA